MFIRRRAALTCQISSAMCKSGFARRCGGRVSVRCPRVGVIEELSTEDSSIIDVSKYKAVLYGQCVLVTKARKQGKTGIMIVEKSSVETAEPASKLRHTDTIKPGIKRFALRLPPK